MEEELIRPKTSRRQTSHTPLDNGNWQLQEEKVVFDDCLPQSSHAPFGHFQVCWNIMRTRKLGNIVILAEWTRSDGKKRRLVLGPWEDSALEFMC